MRIAVLGAGKVGRAVGAGWAAAGHEVRYGVRKPADAKVADLPQAAARPAPRAWRTPAASRRRR